MKAMIYGFLTVHHREDHDRQLVGPGRHAAAAQSAGDSQQRTSAATLFDLPAGVWLVAGLGVVLLVVAACRAMNTS